MVERHVRVLLASETPQIRNVLRQVIEREKGVEVVAQARDVPATLTLASNLRPDVAVIDSRLPYSAGLDALPLSRINGLDAAQAICGQMPNTGVLLLNNLEFIDASGGSTSPDASAYAIVNRGATISVGSRDRRPALGCLPEFASVQARSQVALRQKEAVADKCVIFGVLAFAGGWLLILTIAFAPVGAAVALVGLAATLLGLTARLTASFWRRVRGRTEETRQPEIDNS